MSTKPKPTVIPFRQATRAAAPAMALPLAVGMAGVPEPTPLPTAIDLSGKRKIWFLIGRGRIGKTTFARWLCETVEQRGGSAVFAAADPTNRSLRTYLDDVTEPPSADPDEAVAWFRDLLQFTTAQQANAVID